MDYKKPHALKNTPLSECSINPILGCMILTEVPDLTIEAPLPFVLCRTYASNENYESLLGQGWNFTFGYRLLIEAQEIHLYDPYGNKKIFPYLQVGEVHILPQGSVKLYYKKEGYYIYTIDNHSFHFKYHSKNIPNYRLIYIKDNNDNALQFFYKTEQTFPAYIALDNHRLFALLEENNRIVSLEEIIYMHTDESFHLIQTNNDILHIIYHKEDNRHRIANIETYASEETDFHKETPSLHDIEKVTCIPFLRYIYATENDLIAVYAKDSLLLATFGYRNHMLVTHNIQEGQSCTYIYDTYINTGKIQSATNHTGGLFVLHYDKGETTITDSQGRKNVYTYDIDYYLTAKSNPFGQTTTFSYTKEGQIHEIHESTGDTRSFTYDQTIDTVQSVKIGEKTTHYIYHKKHHKPIIIRKDHKEYRYTYDIKANLIQETLPDKKTIQYERNIQGKPIKIYDAYDGIHSFEYNHSGKPIKYTNPRGDIIQFFYDRQENLIKFINIYGDITYYHYNNQNKCIQIDYPDKGVAYYRYSAQGKLLSCTDRFGATTKYKINKENKIIAIQHPNESTTQYQYDISGNLIEKIDSNGDTTTYNYDVQDKLTYTCDALGNTSHYCYNIKNQLQSLIDPTNNSTHFSYEGEGKVFTKTSPNEEKIQYFYELKDKHIAIIYREDDSKLTYDYTQTHNLLHARSGSDTNTTYTYDEYQRLHKATSISTKEVYSVILHYNLLNQIEKETQDDIEVEKEEHVKAHSTTLSFLDQNIHTRVKTSQRSTDIRLNTLPSIRLSYDIQKRTQSIIYPNRLKEIYVFDHTQALKTLHSAHKSFYYHRDSKGRIVKKNKIHYSYDAIGRLITAGKTLFHYDKAGNNQYNQSIYDTNTNQLLEDKTYIYSYDGRGNMKKKYHKEQKTCTYYIFNDFNQLTKVYDINADEDVTHTIAYGYDAFNRRISKEENNVKHYYLYDKKNIIAILDHTKRLLATIVHHPTKSHTPLSITTKNGTFYYHRDHQGSIIALSDTASTIVEEIHYDDHYGKIITHTIKETNLTMNPYGYRGREKDKLDLYYFQSRYYDPTNQRFLSPDTNKFYTKDFNFYCYEKNDCINFLA